MNNQVKEYQKRFDAQTLRERSLIAFTLVFGISFVWWNFHAAPMLQKIDRYQVENQRLGEEVGNTRGIVNDIRQRIATGVHQEKEQQLASLASELEQIEDELRVKTVELIDPEKMFTLMNELIYQDSRLQLLSLKRLEVKPAIPVADDEDVQGPGIYRHVLEMQFEGSYLDILKYMQTLEALDWKLLWDEI